MTAAVTTGDYLPETDLLFTLSGVVDGSGTALTNSTGVCKIVVTNGTFSGSSVASGTMSYSGTPGTWTYTIAAATLVGGVTLCVQLQVFDATGTTLHYTAPMRLQPAW